MNRKTKSSLILIAIVIIVSPLIYLSYQFTNRLDKKMGQMVEMSEKLISEAKTEMEKTLTGEWSKVGQQSEIWNFTSDSTLIINGTSLEMTIEMNVLIIQGEEQQMIMCIVENDSTLKMSYIKTEVTEMFDKQDFFNLKRIKSN